MANDNNLTPPPGLHNLLNDLASGNFDGVNRRLDIQNGKAPAPAPKQETIRAAVDRRQPDEPQFALSSGEPGDEDEELIVLDGDGQDTDAPFTTVDTESTEDVATSSATQDTPPDDADDSEVPDLDDSASANEAPEDTSDGTSAGAEDTAGEDTSTPDTVADTPAAPESQDATDFFENLLGGSLFNTAPIPDAPTPEPVNEDPVADVANTAPVSEDLAALPTASVTPEGTDLTPTFTKDEEEVSSKPASKDDEAGEGFIAGLSTWVLAHKRAAGIGTAVFFLLMVMLLVLSQCSSGDDDVPAPVPPAAEDVQDADPVVNDGTADKADAPLIPTSATANCQSGSTEAQLAFTPDQSRAWVCVRSNGIDGNILTLKFDKPVIISSANVIGGFNYTEPSGKNLWSEYRHVTKLKWSFSSKERYIQDVAPNPVGSSVKFPNIATQEINVMVMKTESDEGDSNPLGGSGNKDAFAISKITLNGRPA